MHDLDDGYFEMCDTILEFVGVMTDTWLLLQQTEGRIVRTPY